MSVDQDLDHMTTFQHTSGLETLNSMAILVYMSDLLLQVNQLSLWAVKSNTYFSYVNSIIMLHKPSDWYTILVSSHIAKYITDHCSILKC